MSTRIQGTTCAEVWEKSVLHVARNGEYVPSVHGPALECPNVMLEVSEPWQEPRLSQRSPLFSHSADFPSSLLHHDRLVNWHGLNQLSAITELLRGDPFSRRAVVSIWDPTLDLKRENPQGVVALTFLIRQARLHLTAVLRTTDAWMCNWTLASIPELQRSVCVALQEDSAFIEIAPGSYTQIHTSFHLYLDDYLNVQEKLVGSGQHQ